MPTAICTTCNKSHHWRNQRGARLADMRCVCGGKLARAQWDGDKYVVPAKLSTKRGKAVTCYLCGRQRFGRNAFQITEPRVIEINYWAIPGPGYAMKVELPAGESFCWWHRQSIFEFRMVHHHDLHLDWDLRKFACIADAN
jgi:hypothetical protein